MPAAADSRWTAAGAGVAAAALAARLAYLFAYRASPLAGYYVGDQVYYRDWGLGIASGTAAVGGAFEQGPLYAYLLGGAYRILGPHDARILLLQLLAGVATVMLTYACAGRLFGRRAAVAAGLLAALYGPLIFHEGLVMKTFLEPLLGMAALAAALRAGDERRLRWSALAGASVGLLCLVREIHLLLLVPILAGVLLQARRGAASRAAGAARLGVVLLAAAVVIAPATLRNCRRGGECAAVTTGGGEVLYLAYGPDASAYYTPPAFVRPLPRLEHEDFRDEARLRTGGRMTRAEASDYWSREGLRAIARDPGRSLRLALAKGAGLLNDYEYPDSEHYDVARDLVPGLRWLPTFGWIAGLGIAGAALALRPGSGALLPLGFGAVFAAEVLLTYGFGRFRLALAPILILFAGGAVERFTRGAARGLRGQRIAVAAAAALGLLGTAGAFAPPPLAGGSAWRRTVEGEYRSEVRIRSQEMRVIGGLRRHLEADPGDAEAWAALGDESEAVGQIFEAVAAHRTALELQPGRAGSRWALANLAYRQGRLDLAVAGARAHALLAPADARGRLGLAVFCSRLALEAAPGGAAPELRREAAANFEEALRLEPGNALAWYYRGKSHALFGEWAEARRDLARAVALAPDFGDALHALALVKRRAPA